MNQARNPNFSVKIYIEPPYRMREVGPNLSAPGDAIDETQEDSSSSIDFFLVNWNFDLSIGRRKASQGYNSSSCRNHESDGWGNCFRAGHNHIHRNR